MTILACIAQTTLLIMYTGIQILSLPVLQEVRLQRNKSSSVESEEKFFQSSVMAQKLQHAESKSVFIAHLLIHQC